MPEVEFVDPDPDSGQDEELAAGPRREWSPRTKRAVRVAAGAVLAVVAGAVLVGALQHDGSTKQAGPQAVSGTPVLAPEAPSGAFRVDHLGGDAPEGARPGTLVGRTPTPTPSESIAVIPQPCPDVDACRIDLFVTARASAALRGHLPGVRRIDGSSVVVLGPDPTLRSRRITARLGRLSVRIQVQAAGTHELPHSETSTVGAGTTVSATAIVRGFAVIVTVSGPDAEAPGLATVRALAADRRLLTVS